MVGDRDLDRRAAVEGVLLESRVRIMVATKRRPSGKDSQRGVDGQRLIGDGNLKSIDE